MDKEMCDKCGKNEAEFELSVNAEDLDVSRVLKLCENCTMELINKLVANTQEEGNDDNSET